MTFPVLSLHCIGRPLHEALVIAQLWLKLKHAFLFYLIILVSYHGSILDQKHLSIIVFQLYRLLRGRETDTGTGHWRSYYSLADKVPLNLCNSWSYHYSEDTGGKSDELGHEKSQATPGICWSSIHKIAALLWSQKCCFRDCHAPPAQRTWESRNPVRCNCILRACCPPGEKMLE